MKVFMLGWEFPPMVSGGLGVACYSLAKALSAMRVNVIFLLPKPLGRDGEEHRRSRILPQVRSVPAASAEDVQVAVEKAAVQSAAVEASDHAAAPAAPPVGEAPAEWHGAAPVEWRVETRTEGRPVEAAQTEHETRVRFVPVDVWLEPYMTPTQYQQMVVETFLHRTVTTRWETRQTTTVVVEGKTVEPWVERAASAGAQGAVRQPPNVPSRRAPAPSPARRSYIDEPAATPALQGPANTQYAGDLFTETERYARLALAVAKGESFSVVHAHDWMTFEAAMAVAAETGRPLVVQIHSTELDRAGASANPRVMEIEREGMAAAARVVAVSYRTKTQLIERYGVDPRKIEVVYNASEPAPAAPPVERPAGAAHPLRKRQRTVLFVGRLTAQKGPDYFLRAARKVLSVEPDVKFVLAGRGDMVEELRALAEELQIRRKVVFAGFLKKGMVSKALQQADVYVMPSVTEPFGIAPLEALTHDVPVIISKQSGVAEVLRHVLKVDFWDTDELANKILAVLRHPPLAATLREHGQREVRQLSWDDSARRIMDIYEELTGQRGAAAVVRPEHP